MRKILFTLILLILSTIIHAQVVKIVKNKAGKLSNILTAREKNTITQLKITGQMDSIDFVSINEELPQMVDLDLTEVKISRIPSKAFKENSKIRSIKLPIKLRRINHEAFYGCKLLSSIEFPPTLICIGDYAFAYCENIILFTIPQWTKSISLSSFWNCSGLIKVDKNNERYSSFDGSLYYKKFLNPFYALMYCPSSSSYALNIPKSTKRISLYAFGEYCSEIKVSSKNKKFVLEERVLYNKEKSQLIKCPTSFLGEFVVPSSVKKIHFSAFKNCTGLSSVIFKDKSASKKSLESVAIGQSAFENCSNIETIKLPTNYNFKGDNIFKGCNNLTGKISIPSIQSRIISENNIERRVYHLSNNNFEGCNKLDTIFITSGIFNIISIFSGSHSAKFIVDSQSVYFSSQDGVLFDKEQKTILKCPESFSGSYTITNNTEKIGNFCFGNCNKLESVFIPASIKQINFSAFSQFKGVISIDSFNSNYCIIQGIIYNKEITQLFKCNNSFNGNCNIPSSVKYLTSFAFSECENIKTVIIPESVTYIDEYAFTKSGIQTLVLPNSVINIGSFAFKGCKNLTLIELGRDTEILSYSAFEDCISINSISIPSKVRFIGKYAFKGCENLKSVEVLSPDPIQLNIDSRVFWDVDRNECILHVPKGSKEAYMKANIWKNFTTIIDDL